MPMTDSRQHTTGHAAEGVPYGHQLTVLAAEDPHATALTLVDKDGSEADLTWSELERAANSWAFALQAKSIEIGSFVALSVPNSIELVVAALGAWKIGAIPIPMRWDLPEWEQQRLLDVIDPALVLDESTIEEVTRLASGAPEAAVPIVVSPAINGICSSGSTGLPKIILNTAPALWTPETSTPFMANWAPVSRPQTILVPAPMYHTNGFNPLNYLLGGDRLVILEKFDAALVLDAIEKHRITTFTATPTMLSRIADRPDVADRDLSSIEWILQGAAVMPHNLLRRWFALLSPQRVVMSYGMTENLGLTALRGDEWLTHPGSVGRGFRDTEIRVVDTSGDPVPTGVIGEIYLRAPMTGRYRYLGGAPPLPTTPDGFTSAGDLGYLDDDGYLYVVDRRTDMIVTGGANVFPAEVESALIDHPDIADVVVIGVPDPHWGRRVHAVVQAADVSCPPGEVDVLRFAKSRLAAYKVPKTVEFVEQIPRTAATKVNRSAMVRARGG
ncbi:feruloyl-CoA synthetase [Mycobacteroides abscessus subsp. bolletii]|nr:AMP-binding protein [Mycobacteroides abscessus subsp. bolletii]SIB89448.1 feruloyl-CoA synthetase [Mycobacteroides abscessus subsp. bolletii]SKS88356.1 feruloyl-CoA synthetase [Mycobacteroides abscessus subsp. bolletii]SKT11270.1 feruloyl-CoA synthetase [Mycobacteroides abscessus subsp. bolletii]SLD07279.1 feruloyl-CoA synthetase [Mycobacteroides abscessus subsp. bolletii]